MKYENAKDILPEQLLKEVQKYAGGKLLYIPVENESKGWGEVSGYRQKLLKRNVMISNRYRAGATLSELSEEYFLSMDSIKKIVYGKKEKELLFETTVESAVKYSNAGLLEEWLRLFHQMFLPEPELSFEQMVCSGVMKVPLRLVEPGTGEASTAANSMRAKENVISGANEPLLITYQNGVFFAECQQELYYDLKQQKINAYPAILLVSKEEYKVFERMYGRHFVAVR